MNHLVKKSNVDLVILCEWKLNTLEEETREREIQEVRRVGDQWLVLVFVFWMHAKYPVVRLALDKMTQVKFASVQ